MASTVPGRNSESHLKSLSRSFKRVNSRIQEYPTLGPSKINFKILSSVLAMRLRRMVCVREHFKQAHEPKRANFIHLVLNTGTAIVNRRTSCLIKRRRDRLSQTTSGPSNSQCTADFHYSSLTPTQNKIRATCFQTISNPSSFKSMRLKSLRAQWSQHSKMAYLVPTLWSSFKTTGYLNSCRLFKNTSVVAGSTWTAKRTTKWIL